VKRPPWLDSELYPFDDHWLDGGGAQIHYLDEGSGPAVLMMHGNPTWSFLYRKIIPRLSDSLRCIAVDLPGFGLSEAPPGFGFRAHEHARVVADLIQRLDLRDYILMGQDWGGPLGLAAAGRDPQRVAGLVLGNTWAWSMARRPLAHVWSRSIGGIPGRYVVERLNAFVRVAMRGGVARGRLSARELQHYEAPFPTPRSRKPTWVFAREVTGASSFLENEAAPALRELRDRPALIPWGEKDPVFGDGDRARLAAQLSDVEILPLPGAGHFIQEDAPEEIAAAIRRRFAYA
jgi:haloalkane dehalogenase